MIRRPSLSNRYFVSVDQDTEILGARQKNSREADIQRFQRTIASVFHPVGNSYLNGFGSCRDGTYFRATFRNLKTRAERLRATGNHERRDTRNGPEGNSNSCIVEQNKTILPGG